MLLHVVLFRFRDTCPGQVRAELKARLQGLGAACGGSQAGLLHWQVDDNLDLRKGYAIMEIALFADGDALQAFRKHPQHTELASELSRHADWVVGDCPTTLVARAD